MSGERLGKRRGVPKTPADQHYKRRYFSLPPDVVAWLDSQPSGQRSRIVAGALREKMQNDVSPQQDAEK